MAEFIKALHMLPEVSSDQTCKFSTWPEKRLLKHLADNLYIDYGAPTSYWVVIEASLAIVSACLPTLRPVFRGMSPESVIRSVRRVFSLGSLGSNDSKHDGFDRLSRGNREDSNASNGGLVDKHIPMGASGLDNQVTHPVPMRDLSPVPKDSMMVHKSFAVVEDTV